MIRGLMNTADLNAAFRARLSVPHTAISREELRRIVEKNNTWLERSNIMVRMPPEKVADLLAVIEARRVARRRRARQRRIGLTIAAVAALTAFFGLLVLLLGGL